MWNFFFFFHNVKLDCHYAAYNSTGTDTENISFGRKHRNRAPVWTLFQVWCNIFARCLMFNKAGEDKNDRDNSITATSTKEITAATHRKPASYNNTFLIQQEDEEVTIVSFARSHYWMHLRTSSILPCPVILHPSENQYKIYSSSLPLTWFPLVSAKQGLIFVCDVLVKTYLISWGWAQLDDAVTYFNSRQTRHNLSEAEVQFTGIEVTKTSGGFWYDNFKERSYALLL